MKKILNQRNLWILSLIVLFSLFFLMNYFTPVVADDYGTLMHFKFGTSKKITSFSDVLDSVILFYQTWGGRLSCHLITIAVSFLPATAFDMLNTLVYLCVTFLLYRLCNPGKRHSLSIFLGVHILLWICVPDYGQVMFWLCGSTNYLWPALFVLSLLLVYRSYACSDGTRFTSFSWAIPFFILGFLAGNAMDNMSAGMMVILTLYLLYFRKQKIVIRACIWSSYIGSLLGFGVLLLAPGNFNRSNAETDISKLFTFAIITYYWIVFVGVLCIVWLVLHMTAKRYVAEKQTELQMQSVIFIIGSIASAYCMIVAGTSPERTWFIVCAYFIIAIGIYYREFEFGSSISTKKIICIVTTGFSLLCVTGMLDTVLYSREIKVQTLQREAYILQEKEKGNMDIRVPIISHKYPLRAKHDALTGLSDIQEDPNYWINQSLAKYYGVNSIIGYKNSKGALQ
nr:hypothetical protein [Eubacterium sp.]